LKNNFNPANNAANSDNNNNNNITKDIDIRSALELIHDGSNLFILGQ